jgi:hypothetical protein
MGGSLPHLRVAAEQPKNDIFMLSPGYLWHLMCFILFQTGNSYSWFLIKMNIFLLKNQTYRLIK